MSYGKAGLGFGVSDALMQFGETLARTSYQKRYEREQAEKEQAALERQALMDQRYNDGIARQDQQTRNSLLMDPAVSAQRENIPFVMPNGIVQGVQPPSRELNVGNEALYFDPTYNKRMNDSRQMMADDRAAQERSRLQREAQATNRAAYESVPEDLRAAIGDYNPSADYGSVPNQIINRKLAGSATQPGTRTINLGDRVQIIDGATGNVIREEPMGANPGSGGGGTPNVPEAARKLYGFQQRGMGALDRLEQLIERSGVPDYGENLAAGNDAGRYVVSADVQQFQQNAEELLVSILRPETGAAITDTEFERYMKVYIPKPGDKPETVKAKLASAREALAALTAGLPPMAGQQPQAGPSILDQWDEEISR